MLRCKIINSLEKVFWDTEINELPELKRISALQGERLSFQIAFDLDCAVKDPPRAKLEFEGELAPYVTARGINNVSILRPVNPLVNDDNYLRKKPGLYPDVLVPLHYGNCIVPRSSAASAVFVNIEIPRDFAAKESGLTVKVTLGDEVFSAVLSVDVVGAVMPDFPIYFTQWFHTDCLSTYYNVKPWSKRHWEIVENFARVAVKNGINLLLTPVFTPPLDTAVGGERPTVQLVGITLEGGEYSFDFKLLDKWIRMCKRVGVKYLEIAHFFTQWGAAHAPKIMATVDGEYKRIFGWDTEATGEEYTKFLRAFVPALLAHLNSRGYDKTNCFFHVSDEPNVKHLESYLAAKSIVAPMLEGYTIMDALSNYEFYEQGVVDLPIPANNHIEPFIDNGVSPLWTYYCCGQCVGVSNRLIDMPSCRNRSIGLQMYKYDIRGFLQWGYNFYYNCHSRDLINPYCEQDGDEWVPAGDAFSVYPAQDGTALESMRIIVFADALRDLAVMRLLESYIPKEQIVCALEEALGFEIRFDVCATSSEQILRARETVNGLLKKSIEESKK